MLNLVNKNNPNDQDRIQEIYEEIYDQLCATSSMFKGVVSTMDMIIDNMGKDKSIDISKCTN